MLIFVLIFCISEDDQHMRSPIGNHQRIRENSKEAQHSNQASLVPCPLIELTKMYNNSRKYILHQSLIHQLRTYHLKLSTNNSEEKDILSNILKSQTGNDFMRYIYAQVALESSGINYV